MNPFLGSQEQRNTPRGCGFAGACQKLSLLPRKQSKLNQRSQPGRPTRWRRRIRSSRGRNRNGLKNGFRVVGCGVAALVEPHTAPIAARSSTGSRFCTPLQPPGTTAALAPPPRASQSSTRCCRRARPPRQRPAARARTEAALAAAAHAVHIPPRSRAPTASAGARCTYRTHGRHVKALGRGPTFC